MTHRAFIILAVVAAAGSARAAELHMADIQALGKASAWAELLEKALKVAPSERDSTWNPLVTKAAIARISDGTITDRVATADAQALLEMYPHLAGERSFMDVRAKRGLMVFGGCFRDAYNIEACNREATAFVRGDPKNAALAHDMGVLVALSTSPKTPALEYFHLAVGIARGQGDAGIKLFKETCGAAQLADAASNAMATMEGANPVVAKAKELVFDWCWSQMDQEAFVRAALDGERGYGNACSGLLAKNAISGVRATKCRAMTK